MTRPVAQLQESDIHAASFARPAYISPVRVDCSRATSKTALSKRVQRGFKVIRSRRVQAVFPSKTLPPRAAEVAQIWSEFIRWRVDFASQFAASAENPLKAPGFEAKNTRYHY